ncbi:hypothetical protein [Stagnihabitans tardus]|uniref:Uncharacterized protein n=1 Tax=Stagnihabitans tardus TaxID=2699202 RepID=A0AAE4YF98_9RHOB|nr:hypothetical protein [Stagnihabitans tardus]NBZ88825.1 hypothetical protein [Stagnihabitans tardus]
MGKITILDLKGVQVSTAGLKIIKPPQVSAKIEIDVDKKIEKEVSLDKLIRREFEEEADKIWKMTIKMVEDKCKIFEKLFQGMMDKGEKPEVIQKNLDGLNAALKKDFEVAEIAAKQAFEKAWKNIADARKEWRNFKIKIVATIVGTLAAIAVSIAALAVSGWTGGASGAFAIIGFIKAGVTLGQTIKKGFQDYDQAVKELEGHLKVVEKAAQNKGIMATNEITAAVFTEFLGIAQPNIKSCQDCYGTVKAKYAKFVVDVHDLAKTISKIEIERAKMEKDFIAEVDKKLKAHPTKDKSAQKKLIEANLKKKMAGLDKDIAEKSKQMEALYKQTKDLAPKVAELGKRIAQLELKDMKGIKVFREALKLGTIALSPLDGNNIATKTFDLAMGLGGSAGGYAFDKITSGALEGSVFDI